MIMSVTRHNNLIKVLQLLVYGT